MLAARTLVLGGGVLTGFAAVVAVGRRGERGDSGGTVGGGASTWWAQVREFAAEREAELRYALGLDDTAVPAAAVPAAAEPAAVPAAAAPRGAPRNRAAS